MTPSDPPEIKWLRKLDPELDLHWRYLYRLTNDAVKRWTKTMDAYAAELKRDITVDDVQRSVESGDPGSMVDRIGWTQANDVFKAAATPLLVDALQRSGDAEINRLQLAMRFDLDNPYVFSWIDSHTAELVTQVSAETRKAIATVIREAFQNGDPPRKSAMAIRNLMGLTERDSKAVLNYWRTVAMDGNRSATTASNMADTYARKLLRRRAEAIARTETVNAASKGVQSSWSQAQSQNLLLPTSMQEWIAAADSPRTCEICISLDAQKVPLGGLFHSDVNGQDYSGPTAHTSCRCALGLVTIIPS